MILELNEDQKMIQDMARDFGKEHISPHALEWDQKHEFPQSAIEAMGELGLLGMTIPEEYGGAGVDTVAYVAAVEEIAKACSSVAVTMTVNHLVCEIFNLYGSEEQKKQYLPVLCSKGLGSFCLTEPMAGSDAQNQKTTAKRDGDHYVLNGKKIYITNGSFAKAFIFTAVTSAPDAAKKEISAFIVEPGQEGLILGKPEDKMGQCASNTIEVTLEQVRVHESQLIGGENGFKVMMNGLNSGRIGIAALCVGIAQAALELARDYAKERVAFGKPIASQQALQFSIADMATQIESARLMTYKAAYLKDQKQNYIQAASMAKLFASEMCNKVCYDALQIHGGNGYIREYPIEKLYRDARVTSIYEGTSEIQRLVISRQVLR